MHLKNEIGKWWTPSVSVFVEVNARPNATLKTLKGRGGGNGHRYIVRPLSSRLGKHVLIDSHLQLLKKAIVVFVAPRMSASLMVFSKDWKATISTSRMGRSSKDRSANWSYTYLKANAHNDSEWITITFRFWTALDIFQASRTRIFVTNPKLWSTCIPVIMRSAFQRVVMDLKMLQPLALLFLADCLSLSSRDIASEQCRWESRFLDENDLHWKWWSQ